MAISNIHDIRMPLTISGHTQQLLKDAGIRTRWISSCKRLQIIWVWYPDAWRPGWIPSLDEGSYSTELSSAADLSQLAYQQPLAYYDAFSEQD